MNRDILAKELWNVHNQLHPADKSNVWVVLADHILKLKRVWELESRIEELDNFAPGADISDRAYDWQHDRIKELQSELDKIKGDSMGGGEDEL